MAGVRETSRTGSCLPQHVNLPYMQEGERGVVEGGGGLGAAGLSGGQPMPMEDRGGCPGRHPSHAVPEQIPPNRRAQATKR